MNDDHITQAYLASIPVLILLVMWVYGVVVG